MIRCREKAEEGRGSDRPCWGSPSIPLGSCAERRLLLQLLRNRAYVILAVCFGGGVGIFSSFLVLLEQVLCVKGYSNVSAGPPTPFCARMGLGGHYCYTEGYLPQTLGFHACTG